MVGDDQRRRSLRMPTSRTPVKESLPAFDGSGRCADEETSNGCRGVSDHSHGSIHLKVIKVLPAAARHGDNNRSDAVAYGVTKALNVGSGERII